MSNLTQTDLRLASAYFPIIVEVARAQGRITYGELVEKAKELNPDNQAVQNAIAVSTGRRLDVVRAFANELNCPDLTSLVVSKSKGECGGGFTRTFNPDSVRAEVLNFDWENFDWDQVKTDFAGFITATENKIKPRKKIKKPEATKIMSDYWYALPKAEQNDELRSYREYLVELIMEGFEAEEAYQECIDRIKLENEA